MESVIEDNRHMLELATEYGVDYILIEDDYRKNLDEY